MLSKGTSDYGDCLMARKATAVRDYMLKAS